jgi:fatty-acyl-CoA synthase
VNTLVEGLFDRLTSRAERDPEGVFCWLRRGGGCETVTHAQIVAEARGFAQALRRRGVAPGQIVAIVMETRREVYSAFIGAVMAGAVPTLLSPLTRKQDPLLFRRAMAALLTRIAPALVVVSPASAASVAEDQAGLIGLDALVALAQAGGQSADAAPPGPVALLQHSSGSTGLKKGVALSHAAVLDQVERYATAIALEPADVIATWLPLYHDMGLITGFLLPAIRGVAFVCLDPLEWVVKPAALLAAMADHRATLCWLPNFAFHHIARFVTGQEGWDLSAVRMVISCSEPCRAAAFDALAEACAPLGLRRSALQTSYAMAETVFAITQSPPGEPPRISDQAGQGRVLSSGRPLAGVHLRIHRPDGGPAEEREVGEIVVAGGSLFDGYHRQPEATAARLKADGLWTGDLGFLDAGELFVVGRVDDLINVNGRNILAHEIEDALSLLPGVAPGRVMAYPEDDAAMGSSQLSIALELAAPDRAEASPGETAIDGGRMAAEVRRQVLAIAGVSPGTVRILPPGVLVKTSSGKLNRRESRDKLARMTETEPA